MVKEMDIL